ncbi:transglycosylase SLT domain-containing protein, partial [Staphylococcus aureus]|uniref:transglycosylase SLT domain-containing protein n=1 Tax=Staphylococcus aureus TaxID=1280 RepID=UPI001CF59EF8
KTGVSASEWSQIIRRESNGNPTAQNPSSSAHGLFQRLGETSNDWRTQVNNAAELYSKQGLNAWAETR